MFLDWIMRTGARGRILVQVTIYRRLLIGRDGHLDQSEAYNIYRNLYENTGPGVEQVDVLPPPPPVVGAGCQYYARGGEG